MGGVFSQSRALDAGRERKVTRRVRRVETLLSYKQEWPHKSGFRHRHCTTARTSPERVGGVALALLDNDLISVFLSPLVREEYVDVLFHPIIRRKNLQKSSQLHCAQGVGNAGQRRVPEPFGSQKKTGQGFADENAVLNWHGLKFSFTV